MIFPFGFHHAGVMIGGTVVWGGHCRLRCFPPDGTVLGTSCPGEFYEGGVLSFFFCGGANEEN